MKGDVNDPKGLIFESYRIEGITEGECRSIFLDWALSLPEGQDARELITALIQQYSDKNPNHPMTNVLVAGQKAASKPRRRGGWRARERE